MAGFFFFLSSLFPFRQPCKPRVYTDAGTAWQNLLRLFFRRFSGATRARRQRVLRHSAIFTRAPPHTRRRCRPSPRFARVEQTGTNSALASAYTQTTWCFACVSACFYSPSLYGFRISRSFWPAVVSTAVAWTQKYCDSIDGENTTRKLERKTSAFDVQISRRRRIIDRKP